MSSSSCLAERVFPEAAQLWNLETLYTHLTEIKQSNLSVTERACLRGLLCGTDPVVIAANLHRQPQGLRVDLSRGLYRHIEALTEKSIKNWREVSVVLEQAGYKISRTGLGDSSAPDTIAPSQSAIAQNLPVRDFSEFIGREREFQQLLEILSPNCPIHCASVEGMGGTGKTTLALMAAYHCLYFPAFGLSQISLTPAWNPRSHLQGLPFEAIVFASAKPQRLTPHGILPRLKPDRCLRDLFRAIARTLQCPALLQTDFEEQLERVQDRLAQQRTLLIVDNLETVEDYEAVLAFLYDLPSVVKVVITSRRQTPFVAIRLESLRESDSIRLIQHQVALKGVHLGPIEVQQLHQRTSGIPAAIVYAVGQLAAGYPLQEVPARLTWASGDYARFYFESSVMPLRDDPPHQILMTLALFPQPACEEAITYIAASPCPANTIGHLAQLQQRSLVHRHHDRYDMVALTREYAIAELAAHPTFEQQARERWVDWYLQFAQTHGSKDWKEWQEYGPLEQEWENLQAAIEWCIAHDRYEAVRQFWQRVNCYTHAQGYRGNRLSDWETRLDWTNWLIQAAEQRQDWATALDAMFDQGWTLTLIGQPRHLERAEALYQNAWNLRHHKDCHFQSNLAIHIAVLKIQQQQFEVASQWLHQAQLLLDRPQLDRELTQRSRIHVLYYQGEINYKIGDYQQAKTLFQQVLSQAEGLQWRRAMSLAKDWLADIAIQQSNFIEAQQLLEEGLQVATDHRDDCRLAFCKRSIAYLEKARGNVRSAYQWATEAKTGFERLGMMSEMRETIAWLQSIQIED